MRHVPEIKDLKSYDFDGAIRLQFEDGSFAFFDYAFATEEGDEKKYVVVYTEHCGYHVFLKASLKDWREFRDPDPRFCS